MIANLPLQLPHLPNSLPSEGSVRIELINGLLIFSASIQTQERIQTLTAQQKASTLTSEEQTELDGYLELISYLNLVNETMKNAFFILCAAQSFAMMTRVNQRFRWKIGKCCNDSTRYSYMGLVG